LRGDVKVVIGGAPVTQKYADEIGADGYAPDAASAVDKTKELLAAG
jgi:5-methyltetrahydrofolate--homocysteine methyltransferase